MNFANLSPYKFEIFFFSQFLILFGSVFISDFLFESYMLPVMLIINIFAGMILMSRNKLKFTIFLFLLLLSGGLLVYKLLFTRLELEMTFFRLAINFIFYIFVTFEIIKQVWDSKKISSSIMFGLVSGYVSIGLIGYFVCTAIELATPGSFQHSLGETVMIENMYDNFMYYSYITLLSIGYGDIIPVSVLAQKTSVLIGLFGQMYNVIITAIIVGKYLNQLNSSKSI
jgi:voltage-gated potassium channel